MKTWSRTQGVAETVQLMHALVGTLKVGLPQGYAEREIDERKAALGRRFPDEVRTSYRWFKPEVWEQVTQGRNSPRLEPLGEAEWRTRLQEGVSKEHGLDEENAQWYLTPSLAFASNSAGEEVVYYDFEGKAAKIVCWTEQTRV